MGPLKRGENCAKWGKNIKVRETGKREGERYVREGEKCVREVVKSTQCRNNTEKRNKHDWEMEKVSMREGKKP